MMQRHNTHACRFKYTQTSRKKPKRREKETKERCILDLNKALQDIKKPVFGLEENAKQALHQTPKAQVTESSPAGRGEKRHSQPKQKLL